MSAFVNTPGMVSWSYQTKIEAPCVNEDMIDQNLGAGEARSFSWGVGENDGDVEPGWNHDSGHVARTKVGHTCTVRAINVSVDHGTRRYARRCDRCH